MKKIYSLVSSMFYWLSALTASLWLNVVVFKKYNVASLNVYDYIFIITFVVGIVATSNLAVKIGKMDAKQVSKKIKIFLRLRSCLKAFLFSYLLAQLAEPLGIKEFLLDLNNTAYYSTTALLLIGGVLWHLASFVDKSASHFVKDWPIQKFN